MTQVQRGARNRRTPYYEATQKYGPKGFTVYNHMYFPIRYASFEEEFDALLNRVTLWDVAVERCLEISGPDGFEFAQLLTPRDLSKCAVGQAKYVLICDSDAGIINDPVMTRMADNTFWFALASSDALLFARGLKNAHPDMNVSIREVDVDPLQVQGPLSKPLMTDLVGPSVADLKYYHWMPASIAGAEVIVTRTGWTSEVGYEVYLLEPTKGNELFEAIMEAGERYGLVPTGPSDIRRIEGAIFNWGADMTYENNAFEMGLERLVDFGLSDEASISIAAYRRIKEQGVAKKINGVVFEGDPFPELNNTRWPAFSNGSQVGTVTSAIYSPRLGQNIGYCWLPTSESNIGQPVAAETEWGSRKAIVTEMPFVDPEKRIPVS